LELIAGADFGFFERGPVVCFFVDWGEFSGDNVVFGRH